MISLILKMAMIMTSMMLIWTKNPVKLSMNLMMSSTAIFFMMYISSSLSWFPLLFSLIFLGGILLMFMILSSIMPNEKTKKSKVMSILIIGLAISISLSSPSMTTMTGPQMKAFMTTGSTMYLMMTLIMLYFFIFISILSKESSAMRRNC